MAFLTSTELIVVQEDAVLSTTATGQDDLKAQLLAREPLEKLYRIVLGVQASSSSNSAQNIRVEAESGAGYVLLPRDEGVTQEILENLKMLIGACGADPPAVIDGGQKLLPTLCQTLRDHHISAPEPEEGTDFAEDDILGYFLVFRLGAVINSTSVVVRSTRCNMWASYVPTREDAPVHVHSSPYR